MSTTTEVRLTEYESSQVDRIAAWKVEHPNPFGELFRRAAQPVADLVEYILPDRVALSALETSYQAARMSAMPVDFLKKAGVQEITELRSKPLATCDELARGVGATAQG